VDRGWARPFRYFDKGNMAVVGRNFALLESRRIRMSGYLTWLLWGTIHLLFLPQIQSRLRVAGQWLWWWLTDQRSSLLIPETRSALTEERQRNLTGGSHDPINDDADTRRHSAHA
jgi:NADH dehydrogenase